MRYSFMFTASLLLLACASCGSDGPGDPGHSPAEQPLLQGTVGPAGGRLAGDDIVLDIPAGAFGSETELKVFAENGTHPLQQDVSPVYRLEGVPESLGLPLALRFRFTADPDSSLALLRGEDREGRSVGLQPTWQAVSFRDSSGWCITEFAEGPPVFGEKNVAVLRWVIAQGLKPFTRTGSRFLVWYRESDLTAHQAAYALDVMEEAHDFIDSIGFHFGAQDTIWPLSAYLIMPPNSVASYTYGHDGKGFFRFPWQLAYSPNELFRRIVYHEMFHCAQQWYDPRPSYQWIHANDERAWLDEATASLIEMEPSEESIAPMSLTYDNFLAPLGGLAGHPDFSDPEYGYGMTNLIYYLLKTQGRERLLELFEEFALTGDATTALQKVLDPAPGEWILDFDRDLAGCRLVNFGSDTSPYQFLTDTPISGNAGTIHKQMIQIPDFGSAWTLLRLGSWEQDRIPGSMRVRAPGDFDLSLWLIEYSDLPVLAATGHDSLTLGNIPEVNIKTDNYLVLVTKPRADMDDWTGRQSVPLEVELLPAFPLQDYDYCTISAQFVGIDGQGGPFPSAGMYFENHDSYWEDNTFIMNWNVQEEGVDLDQGQVALTIDPQTLDITELEAVHTIQYSNGDSVRHELTAGAVPLAESDDISYTYRIDGGEMCNTVTHIYERMISGGETTLEFVTLDCDGESYLEIYLEKD